ncbi:MAG: tetratricopeptide repeat protein [Pyrinomonadaceae bacterium]
MARYKKKRARELQHDRFRDTAIGLFDRLGNLLEGRGRAILYGIGAAILIGGLALFWINWSRRKSDEARRAMGRAITIATTPVTSLSLPNTTVPGFTSEQERANKAIEEFEKVAAKYGDPYHTEARYFIATNRLLVDRQKGMEELVELSNSSHKDVAALAKFALAQAKEADAKYDEAAQLYSDLAAQNSLVVTPETARLRLALVYQRQDKKKEAADILFQIVDTARKAKDNEGAPLAESAAARKAATELQKLDPDRFSQLPPETPRTGLF